MDTFQMTPTVLSRFLRRAFLTLLLATLPLAGYAEDQLLNGELSQEFGYSIENESTSSLETEVLLSIDTALADNGYLKVESRGTYDYVDDRGTITIREAYTSLYMSAVDLIIGNQIINWGAADGFNPASPINPIVPESLSEEDLRWEPVPAVSASFYMGSRVDIGAAIVLDAVPVSLSSIAPDLGTAGIPMNIEEAPRADPRNFEYAGKIGTYLLGWDLRATYFYGFEDLPVLAARTEIDPGTGLPVAGSTIIVGTYRRAHRVGLAAAGQLLSIGAWGEAAYVVPDAGILKEDVPPTVTTLLSTDEPRFETIVGVDYTLPGGLYTQLQYLYLGPGGIVNPYGEEIGQEPEAGHLLLPRLSYSFGLDNTVETAALVDVSESAALIVPSATLGVGPATNLRLGVQIPVGEASGLSGGFEQAATITLSTAF